MRTLTSCAFGGDDLGTLYVTSASIDFGEGGWVYTSEEEFAANPILGGIFAVEIGVRGLPSPISRLACGPAAQLSCAETPADIRQGHATVDDEGLPGHIGRIVAS